MSHRIHYSWKQLTTTLYLLIIMVSCHKSKPAKNPDPIPSLPPVASVYEALTTEHSMTFCGSVFTSDLKIKDGTTIGTVEIGNDATHLYLTYHLSGKWYLTGAQSYAGKEALIPVSANGNPNPNQFPGKKVLNPCNLLQKLTFKLPLSGVEQDNSAQCISHSQYFIAMRASVKQIANRNCAAGNEEDAWAASVLINPGNSTEWATAFYYCKQECVAPTPTWCAYGQGYWFAKPNVVWCQPAVKFGGLEVSKEEARALWPAQNNVVKKAFFQAAALQLSMICKNNGASMPASIVPDYNVLATLLSGLSYADIQNGKMPANTDMNTIKNATGNIGKWNCQNNCSPSEDPTACTSE